ncbi:hypothetical protein LINGRAHAP2_LOCUS4840 [Linum grandiflorum]
MTVLASGTSYVTTHLFLGEVTKVFLHIREMERSDDEDVRRMADKMLKKVTKYWCEEEGDNSRLNKLCYIAVVFDPRYPDRNRVLPGKNRYPQICLNHYPKPAPH